LYSTETLTKFIALQTFQKLKLTAMKKIAVCLILACGIFVAQSEASGFIPATEQSASIASASYASSL
jgi:hypothetical protein